jgi:RNA ligase
MFRMSGEDAELVCMPPKKFFNYAEGTVDHTQSTIVGKMVKLDGSLISSYLDTNGTLCMKSRASLASDQAIAATEWINRTDNKKFRDAVYSATLHGSTVNMEWISPDNRIVVGYDAAELKVLGMVDHRSQIGQTQYVNSMYLLMSFLPEQRAGFVPCSVSGNDQKAFVDAIYAEQEGEGYVLIMEQSDGTKYAVKVKNDRYSTLHKAKDSILIKSRLYECVLDGSTDDLRSIFATDPLSLKMIDDMESAVMPAYNKMIKTVEAFHKKNKKLLRKSYALKAKKDLPEFMSLCMLLLDERTPDYVAFAKKNPDLFLDGTSTGI